MIEYISPSHMVSIGQNVITKVHQVKVYRSFINPLDRAEIEIDNVGGSFSPQFYDRDPVTIRLGYKGKGYWLVFTGTVNDIKSGPTIKVYAHDKMRRLRETKITQSFKDVNYQDIIRFCLRTAGVNQQVTLSAENFGRLHHFISADKTVVEVIQLINRHIAKTTGKTLYFYFTPKGEFIWDEWRSDNLDRILYFEYGKNLIELRPRNEIGYLKTILLPYVRPGDLIKITDQHFWKKSVIVRVERLIFTLNGNGGRTEMEWRIQEN